MDFAKSLGPGPVSSQFWIPYVCDQFRASEDRLFLSPLNPSRNWLINGLIR